MMLMKHNLEIIHHRLKSFEKTIFQTQIFFILIIWNLSIRKERSQILNTWLMALDFVKGKTKWKLLKSHYLVLKS